MVLLIVLVVVDEYFVWEWALLVKGVVVVVVVW